MFKTFKAALNDVVIPEYLHLVFIVVGVFGLFVLFNNITAISAEKNVMASAPSTLSLIPGDQVGNTEYLGVQGRFLEWARSGSGASGFSLITLLPNQAGAKIKIDGDVYKVIKASLRTGEVWLSRKP